MTTSFHISVVCLSFSENLILNCNKSWKDSLHFGAGMNMLHTAVTEPIKDITAPQKW